MSKREKPISLLYSAFGVLLVMLALHLVGSYFYLYWTVGWFDNLVHFLGGLSMGLLALWIWFDTGLLNKGRPSIKEAVLTALLFVLLVGVGWEIFEYVNGLTQSTEAYPLDTRNDLMADIIGALLAGYIGAKKIFYAD